MSPRPRVRIDEMIRDEQPALAPESAPPAAVVQPEPPLRPSATKTRTVQQTLYLPPAVHDQLRELAFHERRKQHDLVLEGLDMLFRQRGLRPITELTKPKG